MVLLSPRIPYLLTSSSVWPIEAPGGDWRAGGEKGQEYFHSASETLEATVVLPSPAFTKRPTCPRPCQTHSSGCLGAPVTLFYPFVPSEPPLLSSSCRASVNSPSCSQVSSCELSADLLSWGILTNFLVPTGFSKEVNVTLSALLLF